MHKVEVSFEGKTTTVQGETAADIAAEVGKFARENGLSNWLVKDEKDNKLGKNEVLKAEKLRVMRNESAGFIY